MNMDAIGCGDYSSPACRRESVAATSTEDGPPGNPACETSTAPKTALQNVFVARPMSWSVAHPCSPSTPSKNRSD